MNSLLFWNILQYYLSLVHHFQCFFVLGRAQHIPAQQKVRYVHFIRVSYVECLMGNNIINQIMNDILIVLYIFSLIDRVFLVLSELLDVICLKYP